MIIQPTPAHEAFYSALCDALGDSGARIPAVDALAVASQFIGNLIALQDAATMTPSRAMDIVTENLIHGNERTLAYLAKGGAR